MEKMKKQTQDKVPEELYKALAKAIYDLQFTASMISSYTKRWVKNQEKIIQLQDCIEELRRN